MHMRQVEVEEARRKMQMKYKKEAEEAAEKMKQVSNNWLHVLQFSNIEQHLTNILGSLMNLASSDAQNA
jgi:hypothetical protein